MLYAFTATLDGSGAPGTGNGLAKLVHFNALCAVLCGGRTEHYGAPGAASRQGCAPARLRSVAGFAGRLRIAATAIVAG